MMCPHTGSAISFWVSRPLPTSHITPTQSVLWGPAPIGRTWRPSLGMEPQVLELNASDATVRAKTSKLAGHSCGKTSGHAHSPQCQPGLDRVLDVTLCRSRSPQPGVTPFLLCLSWAECHNMPCFREVGGASPPHMGFGGALSVFAPAMGRGQGTFASQLPFGSTVAAQRDCPSLMPSQVARVDCGLLRPASGGVPHRLRKSRVSKEPEYISQSAWAELGCLSTWDRDDPVREWFPSTGWFCCHTLGSLCHCVKHQGVCQDAWSRIQT